MLIQCTRCYWAPSMPSVKGMRSAVPGQTPFADSRSAGWIALQQRSCRSFVLAASQAVLHQPHLAALCQLNVRDIRSCAGCSASACTSPGCHLDQRLSLFGVRHRDPLHLRQDAHISRRSCGACAQSSTAIYYGMQYGRRARPICHNTSMFL
jgi:hypothetical protein